MLNKTTYTMVFLVQHWVIQIYASRVWGHRFSFIYADVFICSRQYASWLQSLYSPWSCTILFVMRDCWCYFHYFYHFHYFEIFSPEITGLSWEYQAKRSKIYPLKNFISERACFINMFNSCFHFLHQRHPSHFEILLLYLFYILPFPLESLFWIRFFLLPLNHERGSSLASLLFKIMLFSQDKITRTNQVHICTAENIF